MGLKDKVALVTGGTSGIGLRTVERLCEEGSAVWFTGRRRALGIDISKRTGAHFIEADAGSEADIKRSIATISAAAGKLDILINNAGGPAPVTPIDDMPMEGFMNTMQVHVAGAFCYMKHAAPLMEKDGGGAIVNIGSVAGHRANYSSSIAYSIAKSAVIHMTRCAAMELGERGIRVNSISPGGIATGILAKSLGMDADEADKAAEKAKTVLAELQVVPRAGEPDDIAAAILFAASEVAGFLNGEDIVIDGGLIWGRRYSQSNGAGNIWKSLFE